MTILKAVFAFLGQLLGGVIEWAAKEGKKPKEVKPIGGDNETRDAIDDSIRDAIDDE